MSSNVVTRGVCLPKPQQQKDGSKRECGDYRVSHPVSKWKRRPVSERKMVREGGGGRGGGGGSFGGVVVAAAADASIEVSSSSSSSSVRRG